MSELKVKDLNEERHSLIISIEQLKLQKITVLNQLKIDAIENIKPTMFNMYRGQIEDALAFPDFLKYAKVRFSEGLEIAEKKLGKPRTSWLAPFINTDISVTLKRFNDLTDRDKSNGQAYSGYDFKMSMAELLMRKQLQGLYQNPITGKHIIVSAKSGKQVFLNARQGRKWKNFSKIQREFIYEKIDKFIKDNEGEFSNTINLVLPRSDLPVEEILKIANETKQNYLRIEKLYAEFIQYLRDIDISKMEN